MFDRYGVPAWHSPSVWPAAFWQISDAQSSYPFPPETIGMAWYPLFLARPVLTEHQHHGAVLDLIWWVFHYIISEYIFGRFLLGTATILTNDEKKIMEEAQTALS
jgi:uncharacterized membrane protein (DUF106 family)